MELHAGSYVIWRKATIAISGCNPQKTFYFLVSLAHHSFPEPDRVPGIEYAPRNVCWAKLTNTFFKQKHCLRLCFSRGRCWDNDLSAGSLWSGDLRWRVRTVVGGEAGVGVGREAKPRPPSRRLAPWAAAARSCWAARGGCVDHAFQVSVRGARKWRYLSSSSRPWQGLSPPGPAAGPSHPTAEWQVLGGKGRGSDKCAANTRI